jgi:hypothetical protein
MAPESSAIRESRAGGGRQQPDCGRSKGEDSGALVRAQALVWLFLVRFELTSEELKKTIAPTKKIRPIFTENQENQLGFNMNSNF